MNETRDAALNYWDMGLCVIPIRPNSKKPLVKWEDYQKERPDRRQIAKWFKDMPNANIAILTGAVSGIDVIDIDSGDAMNSMLSTYNRFIAAAPVAKTPGGGYHIYIKYTNIRRKIRFMEDVDFCGDGGYVLAPPSKIDGKNYLWVKNIVSMRPPELPHDLRKLINEKTKENPLILPDSDRTLSFTKGSRDDSLFHVANVLRRGGMSQGHIEEVVLNLARTCDPPFSEKEALVKVRSAVKRERSIKKSLTDEIKDWISEAEGIFSITHIAKDLNIVDKTQKHSMRALIYRLRDEGLITKHGSQRGVYRKVEQDLNPLDFASEPPRTSNIILPFDLHNYVKIFPGNIILVAGEKDSGKTALLLNIAALNMKQAEVHYFNSEMGRSELRERLELFDDYTIGEWNQYLNAWERNHNYVDVIQSGEGKINIVDFLEIHDEFYRIGGIINEIYRALKGAIAVIAIQKNPGLKVGIGGWRTVEKPRLALACSHGEVEITVAKNWKGTVNPRGKKISYKLFHGCKILVTHSDLKDPQEDMKYG